MCRCVVTTNTVALQVLTHNIAAKVLHYFLPRLRMSQAIMLLIVRATVPVMALLGAIIAAVRNDTGE
jgi:Na+/proline symporter